jgi:hypothetical protein
MLEIVDVGGPTQQFCPFALATSAIVIDRSTQVWIFGYLIPFP